MFNPFISIGFCCCMLLQNTAIPSPNKDSGTVVKVVFLTESRPEDQASDTLFYHQRAVTADDFRASPKPGPGKNEAISFTSFAFDGSSRQFRDTLEITLVLQVFWVKSSSWLRTRPPSAHVLEHEQLHFDITRLIAERFRQKVLQMELTTDDHESRIQYEYLESFRDMNRMQDDYDDDVHSGMNAFLQQEWKRKVRQELIAAGVTPASE